ncbi:MAG: hypothetical protein PHF99_08585 [Bacteroidales bacterium]|nr:hypothetical protein [Bacteroidales bacterium]
MAQKIEKSIYVENLLEILPESVNYLSDKDIVCIRCGAPVWGTLYEAAKEKNYSDEEIEQMVSELNDLMNHKL